MTPLSGAHHGLLRRGSPVLCPRGLDDALSPGVLCADLRTVAFDDGCIFVPDIILLDTSDPTGAFHARLWAGTDPERLKVIREAGVDTGTQAVPVVYQTPDRRGWRHEDDGYIHESDLRIAGNGMRSWLYRLGQPGIIKELPINITGVKRHGFTVRADVAELMDCADGVIQKEGGTV